MAESDSFARPWAKWAGGKSQLLGQFQRCYPQELRSGAIRCYVEPFVGSGAVMFDVLRRFSLDHVVIIDQNERLMQVYRVLQTAVEDLIDVLASLQTRYWALDDTERRTFYYEVRKSFNLQRGTEVAQAADFIFLNRTCFNGLFRVNQRNEFNVPMGRYRRPLICDADNLWLIHKALQKVTIVTGGYRQAAGYAGPHTFVYLDPPYRPLSSTASFTAYSAEAFDDNDQKMLAHFVRSLDEQGAYVMLSNSDPHNIDPADDFFDALYDGFFLTRVPARRAINSRSDRRGTVSELVVTNYPPSTADLLCKTTATSFVSSPLNDLGCV
jgi:DNA adenine methylase